MEDCKPLSTSMFGNYNMLAYEGNIFHNPNNFYRSVVGALKYVINTRPDITFAVNKVFQFMSTPRDTHWHAVKCILHYLKGTIFHCIVFQTSKDEWGYDTTQEDNLQVKLLFLDLILLIIHPKSKLLYLDQE